MIHLILSEDLNSAQRKRAESLQSSGKLLLSIINDILDLSKIEAGKLELDCFAFDLRDSLKEFELNIQHGFAFSSNRFTFELAGDIDSWHRGDFFRVQQVLNNLVSNAFKFTENGQIELIVQVKKLDLEHDLVYFQVKDSGIGLSESQASQLFQKFNQVDKSTTRKYGGTGLGLSICKQIVEMMGGEIGVESELGQGSSFWFKIPLARTQGEEQIEESGVTDLNYESYHILVVEDNPTNQEIVRSILHKLGYQVHLAHHGQDALDKLVTLKPHLILMDCQMPVMDGFEATQRIRRGEVDGLDAHIPIIALTANALNEDKQKCLDAQMSDFLSKPIQPQKLIQTIHKWLKGVDITDMALVSISENTLSPKEPNMSPYFDFVQLLERVMDDQELALDVLETFVPDLEVQKNELIQALQDKNRELIPMKAHRIRGSCGNVGAVKLSEYSAEIEQNFVDYMVDVQQTCDLVEDIYQRTIAEIQVYQTKAKNSPS